MGIFSCFSSSWKEKKAKGGKTPIVPSEITLRIKVERHEDGLDADAADAKSSSFSVPVPFSVPESSTCKVKVTNHDVPVVILAGEADYEGGDEQDHDEAVSMKRDNSDYDLQAREEYLSEEKDFYDSHDNIDVNDDTEENEGLIQNGHVSDPGTRKEEFWHTQKLKRSCSDLAMRRTNVGRGFAELSHPKEIKAARSRRAGDEGFLGEAASPVSVMTHRSADKVILKKHSSSQILPSRSRKLWWKLFLWSHRNLHRTELARPPHLVATKSTPNQQGGGYCSDTAESRPPKKLNKVGSSPGSFSGELVDNGGNPNEFYGVSGMWPQNQWVALPTESYSPFARVDEWVKEASVQPQLFPTENDDNSDNCVTLPTRGSQNHVANMPEEISHANSVIRSLNASSNVAHMTSIGLKVIPCMSHLSSLRSVNLSGNFIVHIVPGCLPKGLHVLNLSRNKIHTVEGLRELTRLRVLDLSYNRISRIGQGLSRCTLIKELYLSGNKISDVEGLHRLLKLTVLDLSFNKITTTRALGQLVANYNSLVALNLLGNPIQSNISDDQLRKTVCSLLPKLTFLNKQPVNGQKAREIGVDAIARAALTSGSPVTCRKKKPARRAPPQSLSTATARKHNAHKGKQGSLGSRVARHSAAAKHKAVGY